MKVIKLNENQFFALLESAITSSNQNILQTSDLKEFPGSEVSATSNTSDQNGELEYGNPQASTTDHVQKMMSYNNRWGRDFRGPIYNR